MVIFEIQNIKEDYSICYSIMQFIFDSTHNFNIAKSIMVKLAGTEIPDNIDEVSHVLSRAYTLKDNLPSMSISSSDELEEFLKHNPKATTTTYCFFVLENDDYDEADVVNYHYFEMIRKYNPNKSLCSLVIIPAHRDKKAHQSCYFRISAFFHAESNSDPIGDSNRYFLDYDHSNKNAKLMSLAKPNYGSRRFFPLLPTTISNYRILAQSTKQLFSVDQIHSELFDKDKREALLAQDRQKLHSNKPYVVYCQSVKMYIAKLYEDLTSTLSEKLKKDMPVIDLHNERINSMSVLATAFFLTFVHAIILPANTDTAIKKIKEELSRDYWDRIDEMMFDAEDFAEGTLQLIENAIKHADSKGYLCFRIFNKAQAMKYYSAPMPDSVGEHYLNVLVSDFNNEFDIPEKFIQNLSSYGVGNTLISGFVSSKLKLRDFFVPSMAAQKCLDEYFRNTENVALHYGLSVFDQIVSSASGYFRVISTKTQFANADHVFQTDQTIDIPVPLSHIPGAQYNILLPLTAKEISKQTGINIAFDYRKFQTSRLHFLTIQGSELEEILNSENSKAQYDLGKKEKQIRILAEYILKCANDEDGSLLIYSERIIDPFTCEVFAKAIVYLLSKYKTHSKTKRIAITYASPLLRAVLIRILGMLYYKRYNTGVVENVEIYICGEFGRPEIEFIGNSISTSIAASELLANRRGEYSKDISLLRNVMQKCDEVLIYSEEYLFPFDIFVFQQMVKDDLERNIQQYPFGCRLEEIHMRVGSKIHVTDCFYEATLLFGIENYVTRFAFLLAQRIYEKIANQNPYETLLLVGYETYSEMLVLETKKALKNLYETPSEYIIYNDSAEEKLKDYGRVNLSDNKKTKYVIIVPIGSTLTTHDKIIAYLERDKNNPGFSAENNILANLCVVIVRDQYTQIAECTSTESIFWTSISETNVILKDEYKIGSKNSVDYLICVKGRWELPQNCSKCYPDNRLDEKPLLKVNKASVVPMVLYGLNASKHKDLKHIITDDECETHVDLLRNALSYGHYMRGDNHFEYYPQTGNIFTELLKAQNIDAFESWLQRLKRQISSSPRGQRNEYHFIVAPQHHTNAGFVMKVHERVFDGAAAIIWLDVKREYRDNIRTKYSFLSQLFINLVNNNTNAEIHFHYIDDTITTGATYERAKDLLQSLFNSIAFGEQGYHGVRVRLFSSVTVLLNRHSADSILKYAPLGMYFSYINLYISSLRNHEDACVLCKKYDNYNLARKLSATNILAQIFRIRGNRYKLLDYSSIKDRSDNENDQREFDKGYCRMLLTHELNISLTKLGYLANDDKQVFLVILDALDRVLSRELNELFPNGKCTRTASICDLLHVISSPFFSFRKSNFEAAFKFILFFADYLIFPAERVHSAFASNTKLKAHIESIEIDDHHTELHDLIRSIFSRLSHLGSNYIIREEVISAFFDYLDNQGLAEKGEDAWDNFYITVVKQLMVFNELDERAYRWENLLKKISVNPYHKNLVCFALLENDILIHDALQEVTNSLNLEYQISTDTATDKVINLLYDNGNIKDVAKNQEKTAAVLNSYFCDSYRLFSTETRADLLPDSNTTKDIMTMAVLNLLLIPNGNLTGDPVKHKHFYQTLLENIKAILKVNRVQLFFKREPVKYFICSSMEDEYIGRGEWLLFIDNSTHQIANTIFYNEVKDGVRITGIKIENTPNGSNSGTASAWYLIFETQEDIAVFPALLSNARNLLVMRDALLIRLQKDYDNNIFDEFATQKEQISLLANDKTGFHTPFPELDKEFEKTRKDLEKNEATEDMKKEIAVKLKLIADAYISKWHVCRVINRLPEQINLNKFGSLDIKTLSMFIDIAELFGDKYRCKVTVNRVNFNTDYLIGVPEKCQPVWISFILALILNSIRHGISTKEKEIKIVEITMDLREDCHLMISNAAFEDDNNDNMGQGMTVGTIKWFFEQIYNDTTDMGYGMINGTYSFYFKIPLMKTRGLWDVQ